MGARLDIPWSPIAAKAQLSWLITGARHRQRCKQRDAAARGGSRRWCAATCWVVTGGLGGRVDGHPDPTPVSAAGVRHYRRGLFAGGHGLAKRGP